MPPNSLPLRALLACACLACLACGDLHPVVHNRIALTHEQRTIEPAALSDLGASTEGWDEVVVTLRAGAPRTFHGVAVGLRGDVVALVAEWSRADVEAFPLAEVVSVRVTREIKEQR